MEASTCIREILATLRTGRVSARRRWRSVAGRRAAGIFFLLIIPLTIGRAEGDFRQVLATLENGAPDARRLLINAVEDSTWYPDRQAPHPAVGKGLLPSGSIGKASGSPVITRHRYTYHFDGNNALITQVNQDGGGEPTQRILLTEDTFAIAHSSHGGSQEATVARTGEIMQRPPNTIMGWPQFLSRRVLAQWLSSTPGVTVQNEGGEGRSGFRVPNTSPASPESYYILSVPSDHALPFRLDFHLSDGSLYSSTEFVFQDNGFFERSQTTVFSGTNVLWEKRLSLAGIDTNPPSLSLDHETFFSPGTMVNDSRGTERVTYRIGTRLPDMPELRGIAQSKQGLGAYQKKTHTPEALKAYTAAVTERQEAEKRGLPFRRILIISAAALAFVPVWLICASARKR
jgi:hypothetical protein